MLRVSSPWNLRNPGAKPLARLVCGVLLVLLLFSRSSSAAEVGDEVQFVRAGQTVNGRVTALRPGGTFVEVEATIGGRTGKLIVKATSLKVVGKSGGDGYRIWKDASGRFEIDATLQSQTAFDVVLLKRDGSTITVPLEKLSIADQEHVASLEEGGENPFGAGATSSAPAMGSSGAAGGGPFALPAPINMSKNTQFNLQKLSTPEGVEAAPSPLDLSAAGNASMQLPPSERGERPGRPVVVSPAGSQLCYGVRSPTRGQSFYTKLMLIDGEKRTTRDMGKLEGDNVWVASADPTSGDILGIVSKHGEDKSQSLCVISGARDGNPRIVAHWRMFPDNQGNADYVRFRKILANQIVVVVYGGKTRAFDYGLKQEVWTAPSHMFNEPAISPGGRYAAVMADKQCAIIETKTGKQLGSIPVNATGPMALGFSLDGLRLALAHGTQVRVIDVTTGEETLLHEATVNLGGMGKPVLWLEDNKYLLLPTGLLLDVQRNLIVWKYNIDQDAMEFAELGEHGLLSFTAPNATTVIRLPHDAARKAGERDTAGITALKAGDPISIVANDSGPGVSAGDLRTWLSDAATRAGYQAASSAPIELKASISRGETKTESYRLIGRGFATEEVTHTPYISKVEIVQAGKTLWQQSTQSGMPFMIPDNKSLQEVAKENERPNANFFQNIQLPRQVLKPEFQNGFGSSRVSANGIAD